jgi:hypothetical protein
MPWAQRLKRVFNIDIDVCDRGDESVKVIASIEDQNMIDRVLAHQRQKEQDIAILPLLTPSPRIPTETLPLFNASGSTTTCVSFVVGVDPQA